MATTVHRPRSRGRSGAGASARRRRHSRTASHPAPKRSSGTGQGRIAHVGLDTERRHGHGQRQCPRLPAGEGPDEQHEQTEREHGDVRVPRVADEVSSERPHQQPAAHQHEQHDGQPADPPGDQGHPHDGGAVHQQGAQHQADRVSAGEPVGHGHQVVHGRTGVVPTVARVRPDQHRMAPDVAGPQLVQRIVGHRVKARADVDQHHDGRHDQRQDGQSDGNPYDEAADARLVVGVGHIRPWNGRRPRDDRAHGLRCYSRRRRGHPRLRVSQRRAIACCTRIGARRCSIQPREASQPTGTTARFRPMASTMAAATCSGG